jgi:hypothetical protein
MAIVQSVSVFPATTTVVASTFAGLCSTAEVLNKKESREERVEENTLGRKRGHEVAEDEKVSKRPKSLYPSSEERPSQNNSAIMLPICNGRPANLSPVDWQNAVAAGSIPKETIIAHTDFTHTSAIAKRRLRKQKLQSQNSICSSEDDGSTTRSPSQLSTPSEVTNSPRMSFPAREIDATHSTNVVMGSIVSMATSMPNSSTEISKSILVQETHVTKQQQQHHHHQQQQHHPQQQQHHQHQQQQQESISHTNAVLEPDSPYWEPSNGIAELRKKIFQEYRYPTIPESDIKLQGKLGCGEFGEVYKAEVKYNGTRTSAAVKTLVSKQDKAKLLKEAAIMGQFQHPYIIWLYGLVETSEKMMLVMEYLSEGDLWEHLNNNQEKLKDHPEKLLSYCLDVVDAMVYLEAKTFIHRDLAARNILMDKEHHCKIGDFGLTRSMEDNAYYETKGGRTPVKWTAPEAILYRKYSSKSDVWSYGMVMYEIWSLGHTPFEEWDIKDVVSTLENCPGYCLCPPPGCPRQIYEIMVHCWNPDHHTRPSFSHLAKILNGDSSALLWWSDEDNGASSKAKQLGEDPMHGVELYRDLQFAYQ